MLLLICRYCLGENPSINGWFGDKRSKPILGNHPQIRFLGWNPAHFLVAGPAMACSPAPQPFWTGPSSIAEFHHLQKSTLRFLDASCDQNSSLMDLYTSRYCHIKQSYQIHPKWVTSLLNHRIRLWWSATVQNDCSTMWILNSSLNHVSLGIPPWSLNWWKCPPR